MQFNRFRYFDYAIVEAIKLICHEKIQLNLAVYAVEQVKLVWPFQPREPIKIDWAIFGVRLSTLVWLFNDYVWLARISQFDHLNFFNQFI